MNSDQNHSDNHLTAQQMQDYLTGSLSDVEMHRIEKHMLECDFCAEAMEGLEAMGNSIDFEQDVSKLKIAIGQKTLAIQKERKPLVLYKKVLRIAAMLAVLIVASVLVTNYFKSNIEQKEYSERKKTELPKEKKDSDKGKEKQGELSSDSTLKPTAGKSFKGGQEITKPEPVKEEPKIEESIKLVDNDKQAKSIEPVAADEMIVMDEVVVSEDEIVSAEIEAAEEESISIESMEVQEEMVMGMEADNEAMPASTRERSMYTAAGAEAKSAQKKNVSQMEIIQPQPFDDKAYQQYLKDSLRYPEAALEANIKGFVMLQFMVGPNGEISQIKVIESPGYGCNEEAIRLLQEGAKWIPGSENGMPTEMEAELKVKFKPL